MWDEATRASMCNCIIGSAGLAFVLADRPSTKSLTVIPPDQSVNDVSKANLHELAQGRGGKVGSSMAITRELIGLASDRQFLRMSGALSLRIGHHGALKSRCQERILKYKKSEFGISCIELGTLLLMKMRKWFPGWGGPHGGLFLKRRRGQR